MEKTNYIPKVMELTPAGLVVIQQLMATVADRGGGCDYVREGEYGGTRTTEAKKQKSRIFQNIHVKYT